MIRGFIDFSKSTVNELATILIIDNAFKSFSFSVSTTFEKVCVFKGFAFKNAFIFLK